MNVREFLLSLSQTFAIYLGAVHVIKIQQQQFEAVAEATEEHQTIEQDKQMKCHFHRMCQRFVEQKSKYYQTIESKIHHGNDTTDFK